MEISYLPKIFSFSGRKRSGKTELCKFCEEYGYEIINFADPLKNLICKLLDMTRNELEEKKDEKRIINLNEAEIRILIEESIKKEWINKTEYNSIREMMQIIGTDIIRKNNPEWHINKIKEMINSNKRYCFGDTRFENEKKFIENLGGECWFIIRPNCLDISNHISETELIWENFNRNIIINNENIYRFKNKWKRYLNNHLKIYKNNNNLLVENNMKALRNKIIYLLNNFEMIDIMKTLDIKYTKLKWLCNELLIYTFNIFKKNKYNVNVFNNLTCNNSYLFGQLETSGYIKKTRNNGIIYFIHKNKNIVNNFRKSLNIKNKSKQYIKTRKYYTKCDDPLIIENLKKWNLDNCINN